MRRFKFISLCRAFSAAVLSLAYARLALAQGIVSELRTGVLAHDVPFLGDQKEHGVDINGEMLFVSPVPAELVTGIAPSILWMLRPRPDVGFDANTSGYTSQFYLGLTWTADLFRNVLTSQDGVFVGLGIGAALNNGHANTSSGNHKALGSNLLFHPSVEIGYRFHTTAQHLALCRSQLQCRVGRAKSRPD
jgi:lipid A 3-O-deacylase